MRGHTRIDLFFLVDDYFEIVSCSTCYFAVDAYIICHELNCTISFDCIVYCRIHTTLDRLNRNGRLNTNNEKNIVPLSRTTIMRVCHWLIAQLTAEKFL